MIASDSFGAQALDGDEGPVLEAFVAEALGPITKAPFTNRVGLG